MAFESAEIALEPLASYSAGKTTWITTKETIARRCDEKFSRRLTWAKILKGGYSGRVCVTFHFCLPRVCRDSGRRFIPELVNPLVTRDAAKKTRV